MSALLFSTLSDDSSDIDSDACYATKRKIVSFQREEFVFNTTFFFWQRAEREVDG